MIKNYKTKEELLKELADLKLEIKSLKSQYECDLTERKRTELERQIVFEIIHGITTTNTFSESLKLILQSLGKVLYTDNCFVALYDESTKLFSFPYFVDKFGPIPEPEAMRKSFAAYVFRTGKSLLLTAELIQHLKEQNEVELVGPPSPSWIGVPLQTPTRTIGVLVLQHYEEEKVYSERDMQFLDSVGGQIVLVIERILAEKAVRKEIDFSQAAIDSMPGLYFLIDNQGKFLRWNKNIENVTRYSAEEIMNLLPLSLFDEPDKMLVGEKIQQVFQTGEAAFEADLLSKDKTKTSTFLTGKQFQFENKQCIAVMGIDISARKRSELATATLSEISKAVYSSSTFDLLFPRIQQILAGIIHSQNFFIALIDEIAENLVFHFEINQNPITPGIVISLNDPQSLTVELIRSGKPLLLDEHELNERYASGKNRLWNAKPKCWMGVPLVIGGRVIGAMVVQEYDKGGIYTNEDIKLFSVIAEQVAIAIQLKNAEEKLHNERLLLRTVIDNIPDLIYCKDIACRKILANSNDLRYLGAKSEKEIFGKTDFDYYPKEIAEGFFADDQLVIQKDQPVLNREEYLFDEKGQKQWLLTSKLPLKDEKGNIVGLVGIGRNITQRKLVEEELKASEIKLNVILESTADGILAVDSKGKVIKTNKRFAELWRIPQFIIDSEDDNSLLDFILEQLIHPDEFISKVKLLYNSTDEDSDVIHFKDGRVFERYSMPLMMNDSSIGRVWSFLDITEQKHAEEEISKRNEELLKINFEKDKFFSIIAHDLKSPFLGLLGISEIMATKEENLSKDELIEYSKEMNRSVSNIFKLIENLLEWAQMQRGTISFSPGELNLFDIVSQNIEIINQRAEQKGITIVNEVKESEKVFADDKMVDTILRNLLTNAVKFTRREGKVNIRAKKTNSNMVEISVSDTGVGISEKDVKKLFKMEEKVGSTGTEGELSTGLGLLLCKEFVDKNGGRIWAESEEGKGSTFYFTLPSSKR